MSESEFQQKYADYDDEKFKLCLQNVLQSTQIVDVIFFCDAILKGWANQIQKSPNQRDLQNKPKEPGILSNLFILSLLNSQQNVPEPVLWMNGAFG